MQFVLVVKRDDLFDECYPQGFHAGDEGTALQGYLERIRRHSFFVERRHAERDPSLKQIIPYVVVASEGGRVALLERSRSGGEDRLHGKLSIGVGGHIEPHDGEADPILAGAAREIEEEVEVEAAGEPRPIGFVNDDSNPVGAVHFGLVLALPVRGGVAPRSRELRSVRLEPLPDLRRRASEDPEAFETWSNLILRHPEIDALLG